MARLLGRSCPWWSSVNHEDVELRTRRHGTARRAVTFVENPPSVIYKIIVDTNRIIVVDPRGVRLGHHDNSVLVRDSRFYVGAPAAAGRAHAGRSYRKNECGRIRATNLDG